VLSHEWVLIIGVSLVAVIQGISTKVILGKLGVIMTTVLENQARLHDSKLRQLEELNARASLNRELGDERQLATTAKLNEILQSMPPKPD
jgi:hypothetical protein